MTKRNQSVHKAAAIPRAGAAHPAGETASGLARAAGLPHPPRRVSAPCPARSLPHARSSVRSARRRHRAARSTPEHGMSAPSPRPPARAVDPGRKSGNQH
jgi:hypothetical protein